MVLAAVASIVLVVDLQFAKSTPSMKNIFFILVIFIDGSTHNIAKPYKLFF
jgi:hypothetical protein